VTGENRCCVVIPWVMTGTLSPSLRRFARGISTVNVVEPASGDSASVTLTGVPSASDGSALISSPAKVRVRGSEPERFQLKIA
jgi:hypothetical protein